MNGFRSKPNQVFLEKYTLVIILCDKNEQSSKTEGKVGTVKQFTN